MSQMPGFADSYASHPDRRSHSRQRVHEIAYVKLDEGNGGIVLDLSEGGLSVQAVASLLDESLPCMRLQLLPSPGWIETAARVVWTSDSKTVLGLEFADLSPQERRQIRKWLSQEFIPERLPRRREVPSPADQSPATAVGVSEPKLSAIRPAELQGTATARKSLPETPAVAVSPGIQLARKLGYAPDVQPKRTGWAVRMKVLAMRPVPGQWTLLALGALLATVSLVAGWVAGRGYMSPTSQKAPKSSLQDAAAIPAAPPPAGTIARVSQIEVVDTDNPQGTIPSAAPSIAPEKNRRAAQPSEPQPQPSRKTLPKFQIWVLSPPRQAQPAAAGAEIDKQSPPIPIGASGDSEGLSGASAFAEPPVVAPPAPEPVPQPKPAASVLREGALLHRVAPIYPALAQGQRIEGTVKLRATIGPDGIVRSVEVLAGPAPLVPAATQAVRQWRYAPTLLNGTPVGTTKDIDIAFRLHNSN